MLDISITWDMRVVAWGNVDVDELSGSWAIVLNGDPELAVNGTRLFPPGTRLELRLRPIPEAAATNLREIAQAEREAAREELREKLR